MTMQETRWERALREDVDLLGRLLKGVLQVKRGHDGRYRRPGLDRKNDWERLRALVGGD